MKKTKYLLMMLIFIPLSAFAERDIDNLDSNLSRAWGGTSHEPAILLGNVVGAQASIYSLDRLNQIIKQNEIMIKVLKTISEK